MARAKASAADDSGATPAGTEERLVNVLALMLCKCLSNTDAMKVLTRAGFSYKEIAVLLGTSYDTVKVTMHAAKKKV